MLANKLDAILYWIKRALFGVVGAMVLAVLTILLLAPDVVGDFVVEIPGLVRLLLVIIVYGVIGALGYSRLRDVHEGRPIWGRFGRVEC